MARIFEVHPQRIDTAGPALDAAAAALTAGALVVLPTETVYGLACRADLPAATTRMFETKRRPSRLGLPLLAPSSGVAFDMAGANDVARALADAFWPGPLTMVLPRTERSRRWSLGDAADTIGVRVPDHAVTKALLERAGPFAATSANVSGSPPLATAEDLVATFGPAVEVILLSDPRAPVPAGRPSTVVDLTGDRPAILRRGAIGPDQLAAAANRPGEGQWVDFTP